MEHKTEDMEYTKIIKPTDLIRIMKAIQENTKLSINAMVCRERLLVSFESKDANDFVMLGKILESEKL